MKEVGSSFAKDTDIERRCLSLNILDLDGEIFSDRRVLTWLWMKGGI